MVGVEEEELRAWQLLGEGEVRETDVAELLLPEAGLDVVVAESEPKRAGLAQLRVWRVELGGVSGGVAVGDRRCRPL